MASVAFHLNTQINRGENPKLFAGSENFKRDFIYVGDVAAVNLWFWETGKSGIFNCGTGRAETFGRWPTRWWTSTRRARWNTSSSRRS